LSSLEEGLAMPPLAKHELDATALVVLSDWIAQLEVSPSLPVDLDRFEGASEDATVYLTWETRSEQNNAGFEVERRTRTTSFQMIGFVTGAGSTDEPQLYTFVDSEPVSNGEPLRYRLKQIDFDGRFTYSPEIEVTIDAPAHAMLHKNYPNPFNPSTIIDYEIPAQLQVSLIVFDLLGREVARLVDADQPAGRYSVVFEANNLPSGTYVYRLVAGNETRSRKLVLAR
jgi:hypothetical protein